MTDIKQVLRDMLRTALFPDRRNAIEAAIARIESLEAEIARLQAPKLREPGPEDYPPGWVTGETP